MGNPRQKKYFITTHGCQMNVFDSEVLAGHLENMGYAPTSREEEADVYIINTCAVRKKAEEKVLSRLGKLRFLKKKKSDMILVVWGCMVQQENVAKRIRSRFHFVDLICGPHALGRFPQLLDEALYSSRTVLDLAPEGEREFLPIKREHSLKAWVPISHGCNNYCTYCIVPFVRGCEKSRKPENIIHDINGLVKEGYKEVTLLGQNVNSYGRDLAENLDFAGLLQEIDQMEGLLRVRFMTSHPKDFTTRIMKVMAQGKKICEHLHLPLQAGSNRVLKLMKRGYTKEYYLDLVQKVRTLVPGISLTTDIITSFPGETKTDFEETLALLEQIRFDSAYTFVYSPREGTKAAAMTTQISPETKKQRIMEVNTLQNRISLEENWKLLNQKVEVLVEGTSKKNPEMYTGRTRTNKIVHFPSQENLLGKLVTLKITDVKSWSLMGKL
jgi:tRNA-2-methylthio-N6-dimethylallyladenosine synthase